MNFNSIIFSIFNGLISIYINCFFFETFSTKRELKFRKVIILGLTVIFILSLIIQTDKLINFITLLFVVMTLSFLYHTKWYNCIFLSFAVILLSSFAELVVALASSYILGVDVAVLKTGVYFITGVLFSKLLSFIITAIIRLERHSLPLRKLGSLWLYIGMLPVASVIMLFVISDYIYIIQNKPIAQTITLFGLCLLIAINILIFYVIDKICDYYSVQQDLVVANKLIENQRNTYRELFDGQTEIKKLRHDLKNVMIGVLCEIENGKVDKAKNYIEDTCSLLEKDSASLLSGNSIIDTLLLIKKKVADSKGIKMDVDLELSCTINVDAVDFSVLLGNTIDNAIEATEKVLQHDSIVEVSIITKNSNIIMIVKNPVDKKVDTNNLLTTKRNRQYHGFGLIQMKNLAHKYNGEVFLDCNETEFKTTIYLNNVVDEQAIICNA